MTELEVQLVLDDLSNGYGYEDIQVRRGIHADNVRRLVQEARDEGWIGEIYPNYDPRIDPFNPKTWAVAGLPRVAHV